MSKKKKITFLIISIIFIIGIKVSWEIYTINNSSIVPVKDINEISISSNDSITSETTVSGLISVNDNESIFESNKTIVNDVLYVFILKKPSLFTKEEFLFDLNNTDNLNDIKKIVIVSGEIYSGEGETKGFSDNILPDLPENRVIWEKSNE